MTVYGFPAMPQATGPQEPRPSRLRPDKRRAILDAAALIFMRDGFGLAGIDDIVAESGVSKRTLYAHFPSKEVLFGAIIQDWCEEILTPLREASLGDRDPRETLIDLGRMFLEVVLSPDGISLYRVVVAEAPRFPDLGRVFYDFGHEPAAELLSSYIRRKAEDGVFRDIDSRKAAEGFFQLVAGYAHDRRLLGIDTEGRPEETEAYLALVTDIFLDGVRRPKSSG